MYKNKRIEMVDINSLRPHEQISKKRYDELKQEIFDLKSVDPIFVDENSNVILDGHHRTEILRSMGFSTIPCVKLDINNVGLIPMRDDILVSKSLVINRGLSGKLFPPKSTKHIFGDLKLPRIGLNEVH